MELTNFTNRLLIELEKGLDELIAVDDLETLFAWRASCILEIVAPKVRAYLKTRTTLDNKYATVEVKDASGRVTHKEAENDVADEYTDKVQTLLEAGVTGVKVAPLRMSEIVRMREEEGLAIDSRTIHKCRLVIEMDLDEDGDGDSGDVDEEEAEPKGSARAGRGRAAAKNTRAIRGKARTVAKAK